jgi:hypothetical protein
MFAATAVAHVAASRPAAMQHPLAPAHSASSTDANSTVHRLNQLFDAGHPSNGVSRAGLVVHQHDNTEGWDSGIYMPQADSGFAERWSTSLVSRQYPGTYNDECGIIIDPSAVEVLCSYYHDMVSWSSGCQSVNMRMDLPPSKPSDTPYLPEQLKDMLEMSAEIQMRKDPGPDPAPTKRLWRRGNGEPNTGDASFWQGKYNEVVIDGKHYTASLPSAVVAVFYIEGGDSDGPSCAERTRSDIMEKYGVEQEQLPIVVYARSANATHAFHSPPSPKRVEKGSLPPCPTCMTDVGAAAVDGGGNCCYPGASWATQCDGPAPPHSWDEGFAACNCAAFGVDEDPTNSELTRKCAAFEAAFAAGAPSRHYSQ